jgi:hypothetical protein
MEQVDSGDTLSVDSTGIRHETYSLVLKRLEIQKLQHVTPELNTCT